MVNIILTAENFNSLEVAVPVRTTMTDLLSTFCQAREIDLDLTRDDVIILDESHFGALHPGEGGYIHELNMYSYRHNKVTRVDFHIYSEAIQPSCSCLYNICAHTERYRRMLWMESEDWGVRDLFEQFAYDSISIDKPTKED